MKIAYTLWATIGTYKDKEGHTAKRQAQIGVVFQSAGGKLSARVDLIPISQDWGGYLAFRQPPSADAQPAAIMPPGQRLPKGMPGPPPHIDEPDDTPF